MTDPRSSSGVPPATRANPPSATSAALGFCALCLALAVGCVSSTAPPDQSAIAFALDPITCHGPILLSMYVDAAEVSERILSPTDTANFVVSPGPHAAAALQLGSTRAWPWVRQTLVARQRWLLTLRCDS